MVNQICANSWLVEFYSPGFCHFAKFNLTFYAGKPSVAQISGNACLFELRHESLKILWHRLMWLSHI